MFTEILKNPADPAGSGKNPAGYRMPDNSKNPAGYPAGPDIRCIPNFALLDEIQDKERRKLNVVIHNLKEAVGQTHAEKTTGDGEAFRNMAKEGLKLIAETTRIFRVGKKDDTKPRLLVVTLTNMASKVDILRAAASLRDTKWSNTYITPDLTWKEREKGRQLWSELARRKEAGEHKTPPRLHHLRSEPLRPEAGEVPIPSHHLKETMQCGYHAGLVVSMAGCWKNRLIKIRLLMPMFWQTDLEKNADISTGAARTLATGAM